MGVCVCGDVYKLNCPTQTHTNRHTVTHTHSELELVRPSWTLCWLSNCFIFISFGCQASICWAFAIMMIYGRKLFLGRIIYGQGPIPACRPPLISMTSSFESAICRPAQKHATVYNFQFHSEFSLPQTFVAFSTLGCVF